MVNPVTAYKNRLLRHLLFFVQKRLQLFRLVVLLQPILVRLQHISRSQGAKRRIHHSKICLSPEPEKGIFFAPWFCNDYC